MGEMKAHSHTPSDCYMSNPKFIATTVYLLESVGNTRVMNGRVLFDLEELMIYLW